MLKFSYMRNLSKILLSAFYFLLSRRNAQSLVELLVAVAVGTIMMLGAITVIVPALKSQTDVGKLQGAVVAAKGLLDNVRVWSEQDWRNIYNLSKGSANVYFLVASSSATTTAVSGVESLSMYDILDSNLVGHFKFDESVGSTTYEFSGAGSNGTRVGTTRTTSGCKLGYCLYFNGGAASLTEYVNIGNVSNLDASGKTAWSVSVWLKPDAVGADNNNRQFVAKWGTGMQYGLGYQNANNNLVFFYVRTGSSGSGGVTYIATSNIGVSDSSWHHLVGTYDGSSVNIYIDGNLNNSVSASGAMNTLVSDPVRISGYGDGTNTVKAYLDDVRIYSRALSATEIKSLYNSSAITRSFYVENVNRDGSGYITTGAGTDDPSTQKITVSYQVGSNPASTLSAYLTRSRNRIFLQDEWGGGAGFDGPYTTSTTKFSTSTSIDNTSSSGSIIISGF